MRLPSSRVALALAFAAMGAQAADVSVVGLFPNKAVLVIDGAAPKTYAVGSVIADGLRLIGVDSATAVFDNRGRREAIAIGGYMSPAASGGVATAVLKADERGHYLVRGQINGGAAQMLLDTGATLMAIPASDAVRLGIDYRKGRLSQIHTANGMAQAYLVRLDRVRVGDIELNQVDAVVQEQGLPLVLLGMSFLNRTSMKRDGDQMTLTKRF